MNSTINYTDAPQDVNHALDTARPVADFLPAPHELIRKEEKEKITIALDKHSLESFKKYAKSHNTKYQVMMNSVLHSYADKFLK